MNCFSFFSCKPKKGELATQLYQRVPTLYSKRIIPGSDSIDETVKLAALKSNLQQDELIQAFSSSQSDLVHITVRKSNYQEIIDSLKENQKFTDKEDFPPNQRSIGPNLKGQITSWKRVNQIIQKPVFIQKGINPGDLLQGGIDNCYFLGALACLAERPYRIQKCLVSKQISQKGIYMVKLVFQGVFTQVYVDDYIPLKNNILFFARNSGKQIWPMIFEKCWAKLFKNYQNTSYLGYPHQSFYALTGAPTYPYYFQGRRQQQLKFWDQLRDAQKKDYPIAFGTTMDSKKNEPVGIVSKHIYTLLQCHQIKGYKLVKLRNPWGSFQWNGRASDQDKDFWSKFTQIQKDQLGYENKNQGIFFMIWEDCPTYFDFIQICELNDQAHFLALRKDFQNDEAQLFEIQTTGGPISISLIQDYTFQGQTITQIQKTSQCFILLAKYNPERKAGYQFEHVKSTFKTLPFRQTILKVDLEPGLYVVYSKYLWNDGKAKIATINLYTESNVKLRAVQQQKYPQLLQKTFLKLATNNPDFNFKRAFGDSIQQNKGELRILSSKELEIGGYGYIVVSLGQQAKGKVALQYNELEFTSRNLTLKRPYRGQKNIKIVVNPGQEFIILFQCKLINYPKKVIVPEPKITRLV